MKLSRFLLIIMIVTGLSLLYVYQQTEIFLLAYKGGRQQTIYEELLDKNHILRYNINSSSSVVCLGEKIQEFSDFQMPDSFELVRVSGSTLGITPQEKASSKQTLFSRIFGIKRQAEAKTIKP